MNRIARMTEIRIQMSDLVAYSDAWNKLNSELMKLQRGGR